MNRRLIRVESPEHNKLSDINKVSLRMLSTKSTTFQKIEIGKKIHEPENRFQDIVLLLDDKKNPTNG